MKPLDVFQCPLHGTRLIEASAGTGKTWNICGLVLRLLLQRCLPVQQVLVVTFTNAATAELRERVRARIAETLARLRGARAAAGDPFVEQLLHSLRTQHGLADDDMARRLDAALHSFDEAAIFTIHGFCQRALSDTPFSAGLPMAPTPLADDEALRLQVVQDFWRRHVAGAGTPAVPPALATQLLMQGDSPQRWAALLKRQLAKPLSRLLWPPALDAADRADLPALQRALQTAHQAARHSWQAAQADIVALVRAHLPHLNGVSYKPATLAQAQVDWQRLLASADALHAPGDLDKLHLLSSDKLVAKKGQPPVPFHPFFDQASELLAARAALQQALGASRQRLLRQLLEEGPAQLRALKREQRVLAYDDLLFNLHHRLHSGEQPGLAAALRARFPVALIDEFQDTDPLQFGIFQTLYAPQRRVDGSPPAGDDHALFLVGDPKQAIYSFRNADLHTYLQARTLADAQYTLADNQRASAPLLQGLNALFGAQPQAFLLPGLQYQPVHCGAKPRPAWHDDSAPRAALQLWQLPTQADGTLLTKTQAQAAAAQACAGEIARLLNAAQAGAVRHAGRPLAGGDMAVLVRSHRQGALMRQALAALGVASVELSQASVFHSPDAEDLERVLAAVLEPTRVGLLRAALATPLLGLDAQAIHALADDDDQLPAWMARFSEHRRLWLQRGVGVMLRSLVTQQAVSARLLARADGERRLTNLLHLQELLQQAEAAHPSADALLRWLQTQRASTTAGDDSAQLRLASDRHLVQIVTIHKSKGLEYPLVFCPFLWDGATARSSDGLDGRSYHDEQGQPVLDFRADADIPGLQAVREQLALEQAAETLRLIYVALTRAVQRCYLVLGCYGRRAKDGLSPTESLRSRLNWLVAGAGCTPAQWPRHTLGVDEVQAAWRAFAQSVVQPAAQTPALAAAVSLQPLPDGPWQAVAAPPAGADEWASLPVPASLPGAWWVGSYSSLTQGAQHEAAALDHDARAMPRPDGLWPAPASPSLLLSPPAHRLDDDDILLFPRGPEAGNCLHAVFERVDFTQPDTWPAAIQQALQQQPPGGPGHGGAATAARWPAMLQRLLADVLHTPLPGAGPLAAVPPTRRLVELEFLLPAADFQAGALLALLRTHGWATPGLSFTRLQGYLRGFIDLVFEHQGRYGLLDWKSNHLGEQPADYGAAPLARAMAQHGYPLQALLYTVALHRHLALRLPGYRYDQHFGGAYYLFVRGVRPGWQGADGQPTGVVHLRPPLALVEGLSALLQPRPSPVLTSADCGDVA